ncbi:MAG: flagellar basal body P-ring protein FlgI [Rhizobiaceae bacterium]
MRILAAIVFCVWIQDAAYAASRLKDIATLQSARENLLIGYGLVVGLQGTGDGLRNSPFTAQSMEAMLSTLGIASGDRRARSKNVAAVIVSAKLPVFARPGARLDVTVSSIGDAVSLSGGTLVMTSLQGPDGEVYGAAQGAIIVSGFQAAGQAEAVIKGIPTTGRIPGGATVEKRASAELSDVAVMTLQLRNPDFSTAIEVTDVINSFSQQQYGRLVATEVDSATITLVRPKGVSPARFFAAIEGLRVVTDTPARVVVDERTGTVVIGQNVQISPVAVSHGTLSVRVSEYPEVVQPEPFSAGQTAIAPSTVVATSQSDGQVARLGGTNLQELVNGLNQLGVKPQDTIAIIQAIKSSGALHAELLLQ